MFEILLLIVGLIAGAGVVIAVTRTHELREALEQQTATSEILRIISISPNDVQPVFDTIAQSAARLCKAQFCQVFRFDGALIHFAAHHGLPPAAIEAIRQSYPIAPGRASATARSIASGAVEQIPDAAADPDYAHRAFAEVMKFRSIVAVPMLKDAHPVGAIAMGRSQTGYFPEQHIKLLRTFADQAVIAIDNVRLFEKIEARTRELSEALEQQTATSEVLERDQPFAGATRPGFSDHACSSATRICGARSEFCTATRTVPIPRLRLWGCRPPTPISGIAVRSGRVRLPASAA